MTMVDYNLNASETGEVFFLSHRPPPMGGWYLLFSAVEQLFFQNIIDLPGCCHVRGFKSFKVHNASFREFRFVELNVINTRMNV